jgi:hypothetical protein
MKVTKKELEKIIKEEKQKLLMEMSPIANAERMQGVYSDTASVAAVERAVADLLAGTDQSAFEDMGDEDDADDAAVAAVTITIAQTLQGLGLLAQYEALIRTLR